MHRIPDTAVVVTAATYDVIAWNPLAAALKHLPPRERTIINQRRLRENGATLEELGRALGVSKERVRQIQNRALEKLRASAERVGWEPSLLLG